VLHGSAEPEQCWVAEPTVPTEHFSMSGAVMDKLAGFLVWRSTIKLNHKFRDFMKNINGTGKKETTAATEQSHRVITKHRVPDN
jgi:hypothetical protein